MEKVRLKYVDGTDVEMSGTMVQVRFDDKVVRVWRGHYWEEIPFAELTFISAWEE